MTKYVSFFSSKFSIPYLITLGAFIMLTFIMLFFIRQFKAMTSIFHPQEVTNATKGFDPEALNAYHGYFVADMIWPIALLVIGLAIYQAYWKVNTSEERQGLVFQLKGLFDRPMRWAVILATVALFTDYWENISFMTFQLDHIVWIQRIKVGAYGLFFIVFPMAQIVRRMLV